VYTSHYMEEVQTLCSRIGIMDRGRLIACDTLPNLLALRDGWIRFRLSRLPPGLRERLDELPDCRLVEADGRTEGPTTGPEITTPPAGGVTAVATAPVGVGAVVRLTCRDVKRTLLRLGPILLDAGAEALDLEAEEPNLENVFLHLTGKALRD